MRMDIQNTDARVSIPTGRIIPVEGTPMDFRVRKAIGRDIEENYKALVDANGYDHNWTINGDGFRKAVDVYRQ